MGKRGWIVPMAAMAGVLLYREWRRGTFRQMTASMEASGLPSAEAYDRFAALLMSGLYNRIAADIASAFPRGELLDVGCGPGRMDIRLAQIAPELSITGVDVDPGMVERATANAVAAGVADRVRFRVGDVAALPFPEEQFEGVVSTLSLHHWPDPPEGLAEIHRVLKAGRQARIYDIPDWVRLNLHGRADGMGLRQLAAKSPFGGGVIVVFRWPWRVPSLRCLVLRRG